MSTESLLLNLIKSRRTIRKYKKLDVKDDLINKILEAARWAPSAHNIQPWKFVVVKDTRVINEIYEIMMKKEKQLLAGFNIVLKETAKCLINCKCVIVAYTDGSILRKFNRLEEPYASIGRIYEIQSVSFAIDNIMLYVHALGLGTACLGMALFCEKEINKLLKQKGNLIALLSLGFPDETPAARARKSLLQVSQTI
ncbi:MAG: nitroreductase family protein [Candidatus Omnitrophica bacterium]|nr:nitroreductase family protein [Candidatus Omnitrophota bacterium]